MRNTTQEGKTQRRYSRFKQAGSVVATQVRETGASRGFAEARLLTQWDDIVGPELAAIVRPVKVSYTAQNMGATLLVACPGARATEVQMQADIIRERVNRCYGYNAISRVRLSQQDAAGFAQAQARFTPKDTLNNPRTPDPRLTAKAAETVEGVENTELAQALTRLGENILTARRGRPEKE